VSFFYIISKLFTYLILPPGIFIVISLLALFFIKRFKWFFACCALAFYLLSNTYVSNALLYPLEKPYNIHNENFKDVDAVVVLGGGKVDGATNLPLSSGAFKRAMWGLMISHRYNLPLVFSGGGLDKHFSEADAFLQTVDEVSKYFKIKFNKEKIFIENKSLNTLENAKYTKELLSKKGIKANKIILVTSAYHMKRALEIYRYFGFSATPMATDFLINDSRFNLLKLLPNIGAFKNSYIALHEYFGILSLYLKLK